MRGNNSGGRFDTRYDVGSMYEGMSDDLYAPAGTVLMWYLYSAATTTVDPVYDIGDPATGGRRWTGPYRVPVLGVRMTQGETQQSPRGLYTSDTLHAVINAGQAMAVFDDVTTDPDVHLKDRFVYRGELWEPTRVWNRGTVKTSQTVISLDAAQVKGDQIVNDGQWVFP